jgi:hypothetical protein
VALLCRLKLPWTTLESAVKGAVVPMELLPQNDPSPTHFRPSSSPPPSRIESNCMFSLRSTLSKMSLSLEKPLAQLLEAKYVSAKSSQSLIFASSEVTTIHTKSGLPVRKCLVIIFRSIIQRHHKLRIHPVPTSLLSLSSQKTHATEGHS